MILSGQASIKKHSSAFDGRINGEFSLSTDLFNKEPNIQILKLSIMTF